jgi:hypothetical protein
MTTRRKTAGGVSCPANAPVLGTSEWRREAMRQLVGRVVKGLVGKGQSQK